MRNLDLFIPFRQDSLKSVGLRRSTVPGTNTYLRYVGRVSTLHRTVDYAVNNNYLESMYFEYLFIHTLLLTVLLVRSITATATNFFWHDRTLCT